MTPESLTESSLHDRLQEQIEQHHGTNLEKQFPPELVQARGHLISSIEAVSRDGETGYIMFTTDRETFPAASNEDTDVWVESLWLVSCLDDDSQTVEVDIMRRVRAQHDVIELGEQSWSFSHDKTWPEELLQPLEETLSILENPEIKPSLPVLYELGGQILDQLDGVEAVWFELDGNTHALSVSRPEVGTIDIFTETDPKAVVGLDDQDSEAATYTTYAITLETDDKGAITGNIEESRLLYGPHMDLAVLAKKQHSCNADSNLSTEVSRIITKATSMLERVDITTAHSIDYL